MSTCGQSCTLCLVDFHRILQNLRSINKEENSAPLMALLTMLQHPASFWQVEITLNNSGWQVDFRLVRPLQL